jgi:hypothetical protein
MPTGTPGQEPDNTTSTETTSTDAGTAPKADSWEGIPDEWAWTKTAVERANSEAASRRVQLREAEDKLKAAKTPEEVQAIVTEYSNKSAELETTLAKERAARKHKLADDVIEFLTGTTEEQIEKQAAKLASLKPAAQETRVVTQVPPAGGVTPGTKPSTRTGRDEWKAYKERR